MNIRNLYQEKNLDAIPEIVSTKDLILDSGIESLQGTIQVDTKAVQLDDEILNWLYLNGKIKVQIEIPEFLQGEDNILISLSPVDRGNSLIGSIHTSVLENYRQCRVFGWMTTDNFTPSELDKAYPICRVAKFFSNLSTNPLRESVFNTYNGGKKDNPETKAFLDELNALKAESDDLYVNAVSQALLEADNTPAQINEWVLRFKTERSVFRGEISFDDAKKMEIEFKEKPPLRLNQLTTYKVKSKKVEEIDPEFIQKLKDKDVYFIETEEGGRWHNWPLLEQEDRDYLLMGSNSSKIRSLPGMTRKA